MWRKNKGQGWENDHTVSHLLSLMAQFIPPLHFFFISSPPFFKNSAVECTFSPFAEQAVSR